MPADLKSKLPRLDRAFYQGPAIILWTHTMADRATGWLDDTFHQRFREILLHASHRYELICPCYVLMPDHWHVVWMGLRENSDQWLATAFLRKHLPPLPGSVRLQDRAHDHVLRKSERERGAFDAACSYVCQNPERACLCSDWRDWPHLGCLVPGYPELDPRRIDFWDTFWRIHRRLMGSPSLLPRGPLSSPVARSVRSGMLGSDSGAHASNPPCAHAQGHDSPTSVSRSPLRAERDASPNPPCAHAHGYDESPHPCGPPREQRDAADSRQTAPDSGAHAQGYEADSAP